MASQPSRQNLKNTRRKEPEDLQIKLHNLG